MNELWLLLLAYLSKLLGFARTHFWKKKLSIYSSTKKYFEKGASVEHKDGRKGVVWRRYVKIKTGEPTACSIMWEDSINRDKVSPFVSVVDMSPKFNIDGIRLASD